MEYNEALDALIKEAKLIKKRRDELYGEKWKEVEVRTLENFAQAKLARFVATQSIDDLIDACNYIIFLYARWHDETNKGRT